MYETKPMLEFLLGSRTRARVLVLLFKEPGSRPWLRELLRGSGTGVSSLIRNLDALERAGVIWSWREGGGKFFTANEEHPLCAPLRALAHAVDEPFDRDASRRHWIQWVHRELWVPAPVFEAAPDDPDAEGAGLADG